MLEFDNLKESLETFRDAVIADAKRNLKSQDKVASGGLYDSIVGQDVVVYPSGSLYFEITMPLYGFFVDKGVSGVKQKYNTPYSYKRKGGQNSLKGMPPPSKLDKWIVRKGIGRKGKGKGKFTSRKTLQFLIARSIFFKGFKPSLFFTKPFQKHYAQLPEALAKSYNLDIERFIQAQFIHARQKAK